MTILECRLFTFNDCTPDQTYFMYNTDNSVIAVLFLLHKTPVIFIYTNIDLSINVLCTENLPPSQRSQTPYKIRSNWNWRFELS